ncbi:unnamed protein product [Discosporangium mesarthrocarpum]
MGRKRRGIGSLPIPLTPSLGNLGSISIVGGSASQKLRKRKKRRRHPPCNNAEPGEDRVLIGECSNRWKHDSNDRGNKFVIKVCGDVGTAEVVMNPQDSKPKHGNGSALPSDCVVLQDEKERESSNKSLDLGTSGRPSSCSPPGVVAKSTAAASHSRQAFDHAGGMKGEMTPGEVIASLLPRHHWELGRCWGSSCRCSYFSPSVEGSGTICGCGHRSVAHELQDRGPARSELAGLRRLFAAVRNMRAVGDCGLFEDSEGICTWGAGWFLSRIAREYLALARQEVLILGESLYGSWVVCACLDAIEGLLSGEKHKAWDVPQTLPSKNIYQALGVALASELDLVYWHVRYTALGGGQGAGQGVGVSPRGKNGDSGSSAVPPPEVYFVGLVFHMPNVGEVLQLPHVSGNPWLRGLLEERFDLELGASSMAAGNKSPVMSQAPLRHPVFSNPLLAVAQAAWLETAVSTGAHEWVPWFPLRPGHPEGTMRGSDPALPPPIRARCDAVRDWSARMMAFAVPNRAAIEAMLSVAAEVTPERAPRPGPGPGLTKAKKVGLVEVGAGLGYWKWVLEHGWRGGGKGGRGGDRGSFQRDSQALSTMVLSVLALDKDPTSDLGEEDNEHRRSSACGRNHSSPPPSSQMKGKGVRTKGTLGVGKKGVSNEYHGDSPSWSRVQRGGEEVLHTLGGEQYPCLLLCYPPPASEGSPCMGTRALTAFRGQAVFYVGEIGGDTGSPQLERALTAGWELVQEVGLPSFSSTANKLMVFKRKGTAGVGPRSGLGSGLGFNHSRDSSLSYEQSLRSPLARPLSCCTTCGKGKDLQHEGEGEKRPAAGGHLLRRCRLTRAVMFCSEGCMRQGMDRWKAEKDIRHIHAPGRSVTAAESAPHCADIFWDKKIFKRLVSPIPPKK